MGRPGECAGIRPLLGVYVTGAITPADRAVVVWHLASCERCRDELAGLAALPALLRRLPALAASPPPGPATAGTTLQTDRIGGVTVLTDAAGFTLYWFAADTATRSNCTGSCATYWPPVKAPATAGAGLSGTVGWIRRPDGSIQSTYDGHPLYTASVDTAPGQARGNGVTASGGLWHEAAVPGAAAPATSPPPGTRSASSGGGYGY